MNEMRLNHLQHVAVTKGEVRKGFVWHVNTCKNVDIIQYKESCFLNQIFSGIGTNMNYCCLHASWILKGFPFKLV